MRTRFGAFELDDERLQLTRAGRPVELRPKVFDLLATLVRERHRVVRREELFGRLWSTTAVGPGSLSGLVNELRSALGENGRGPSSIRTVHARGYQFAVRAEEEAAGPQSGATPASPPSTESRETDRVPVTAQYDAALEATRARLVEALCRALAQVRRSGARALVASIPGKRERSAWLACAAAEALAAGFRPRWAAIPYESGDIAESGLADEGRVGGARACASASSAVRDPIALCLEIDDPGDWGRAGGLRRFLDLLGGAPVLVVAALPIRPGESAMQELVARDARVEWLEQRVDGRSAVTGLVAMPTLPGAPGELALALRALAQADRPAFEAALRAMGFESQSTEPVRALRRVEPASPWTVARRDAEVG